MDFDLTGEQRMFWDSIADFCDHEIAPLVDEAEAKEEFPHPLFKKLGALGFLCCRYPEEYGGAGADKICECLYMEELNRVCCGIASSLLAQATLATSPIFDFGTEEQKQKYLVPAIQGEKSVASPSPNPTPARTRPASEPKRSKKEIPTRSTGGRYLSPMPRWPITASWPPTPTRAAGEPGSACS
jgi:alkylation response protein AidB-like acyl-CoA dehydrogenase